MKKTDIQKETKISIQKDRWTKRKKTADKQKKKDRQTKRKNRQTNKGQSVERDHRVIIFASFNIKYNHKKNKKGDNFLSGQINAIALE